jgi:hypothetical protein
MDALDEIKVMLGELRDRFDGARTQDLDRMLRFEELLRNRT